MADPCLRSHGHRPPARLAAVPQPFHYRAGSDSPQNLVAGRPGSPRVFPYCLRVCLAFLCVMFIAYLVALDVSLLSACLPRFTLCMFIAYLVVSLLLYVSALRVAGGRRGEWDRVFPWARRWSQDELGRNCVSLAGKL